MSANKKELQASSFLCSHYALSTLPLLKQEVQTYILFAAPFTLQRTDFTLDRHILLVLL